MERGQSDVKGRVREILRCTSYCTALVLSSGAGTSLFTGDNLGFAILATTALLLTGIVAATRRD